MKLNSLGCRSETQQDFQHCQKSSAQFLEWGRTMRCYEANKDWSPVWVAWDLEPSLSKYGREEDLCPRTFLGVIQKVHHSQKMPTLQEILSGRNF